MRFVVYIIAMPIEYQWGIFAFLGMLATSFIGMFVILALIFLYIFVCLQLKDFFLLKYKSVAFTCITWVLYLIILINASWLLFAFYLTLVILIMFRGAFFYNLDYMGINE
jgi:hypothetical protein